MNNLLSEEDSARIADALIAKIREIDVNSAVCRALQNALLGSFESNGALGIKIAVAVRQGVEEGIKQSK